MKERVSDKLFRELMRIKYKFTCQRCHKQYTDSPKDIVLGTCRRLSSTNLRGLHVSHYWSRSRENTRFDEDNCILLCYGCHRIWGHGDGRNDYTEFMIKKLTQQGYDLLMIKAHLYFKRDNKMTELILKAQLREIA